MSQIYIKLRKECQQYFVDANNIVLEPDTCYIVETEHGIDVGHTCKLLKENVEGETEKKGKIIKAADEEDMKKMPDIASLEKKAFDVCKEKINEKKLEMKLVSVKSLFDKTKIIFYFVAENRIDFRELVRDIASVFKTRIEMRQIGVRDETKFLGGYGLCGRELCCGFIKDSFEPVSIKMAKEQNLNLNFMKISGMCGRLLCCLGFEYDVYKEINKEMPFIDSFINIGDKSYKVISIDTLKGRIRLKNEGNIIDIYNQDIYKKGDKFFANEDLVNKMSDLHAKEHDD